MPKIWDDSIKRVFAARPQDLVQWLLPGAALVSKASLELKTLTRTITADTLYKVLFNDCEGLLHVEFQKRSDAEMAHRVWEYNVLATLEYTCPVYSFVIYTHPVKEIVEPPLIWSLPELQTVHAFQFWNVKLWEIPVEVLLQTGLLGLLPLCMLANGGVQHAVAEEVFSKLQKERELLTLAITFAAMTFTAENDAQWLERKVVMLEEIVQDSWFYQRILQRGQAEGEEKGLEIGLEQGLEKGLEQGLEKGRAEGIRLVVLATLEGRFPETLDLAKQCLDLIQDAGLLLQVHARLIAATSRESVEDILSHLSDAS